MEPSTFDVAERRKRINIFKVGKLWVFKHFFIENKDLFRQLADHYNRDMYRFEFKSVGERNQAIKLLEWNGFDVYPEEFGGIYGDAKREDFPHEGSCRSGGGNPVRGRGL